MAGAYTYKTDPLTPPAELPNEDETHRESFRKGLAGLVQRRKRLKLTTGDIGGERRIA